jgi:Cu(I)/Ag(I) efflux system membrane protein CusA/SilA
MVETTVRLRPRPQWRKVHEDRWWTKRAQGSFAFLASPLRRVWPDERPISWEELTSQMNRAMQFPGWTNAYTMPIKTRIDMLSTGVRTPVGVKIQGKSLEEIEKVGIELEGVLAPIRGTRSVVYERSLGGLYVDVVPDRDALARWGVSVGQVERTIEAAIGGTTTSVTIEGRNRFSINVRYPQDVRDDVEKLRKLPVPVGGIGSSGSSGGSGGSSGGGGGGMEGKQGALEAPSSDLRLAQMSPMGGGGSPAQGFPGASAGEARAADFPTPPSLPGMGNAAPDVSVGPSGAGAKLRWVTLGQLAKIEIVGGPPMVRDEGGLLTGYVYVDVDPAQRDIGGYVDDAKAAVARATASGALKLPSGTFVQWTGQYELLEQMSARMKIVVPITLGIIVFLLWLQFRNFLEALIVLLSIPFALVGSVWLLWALDYRVSTAVWVGVIALVGLAAQTGVVMIVYIDHAFERRKAAGMIRDLNDIVWAHMEGTVQRVRPKLMTVGTMLCGLIPLLWASGSGADVMKRVAVPMIGGLLTSAFLTLEIIPVIYTYWRYEHLLWERLAAMREGAAKLRDLRGLATVVAIAWGVLAAVLVARIYVVMTPATFKLATLSFLGIALSSCAAYSLARRSALRLVWP